MSQIFERIRKNKKYRPLVLVLIYRGIKAGLNESQLCDALGISRPTFAKWKKGYRDVREVITLAKKELSEEESFPEWIYSRLSPNLQKLWDEIGRWEEEPNGVVKIEMMLSDNGVRVRQQLFLHALCAGSFSFSEALRKVNISKRELDRWINTDPGFSSLVEEVQWHKSNFFEQRLVDLAKEGNQAAIIFGNKTLNADRGYKSKDSIDVNVKGSVAIGVLDLSLLLPYMGQTAKMELLEAVRRFEEDQLKKSVIPIERMPEEIIAADIAREGTNERRDEKSL